MTDIPDLKLRFLGSLVEQLGAQMYPSATATIAELISNAWDADARNVWVEIPLGERWTDDKQIIVIDDGIGMSYEDARDAYLHVGRKRRLVEGRDRTPSGRLIHGRKGIGKLAAFGTASILELATVKNSRETRFRLNYDNIRRLTPGSDYRVEEPQDDRPLHTPNGDALAHGTRITLSQLKLKRAIPADQFTSSMSRRFALGAGQMNIYLNSVPIQRFNLNVEFRFPGDGTPPNVNVNDGWAEENLATGELVRWWIGFTETPLKDQALQGISVLARGKMVQRPFLFQRSQGAKGQLGQEYLVGEVQADWLDVGDDIDTDHIQANRDQLQLEDDELSAFIDWGRSRLQWALSKRNDLRVQKNISQFETTAEIEDLLSPFTPDEQRALKNIAVQAARVDEMPAKGIFEIMQAVVDARDDTIVRKMWQEINQEDPDIQPRIWNIVHRFGLIDARRNLTIIRARLDAIDKLKNYVHTGATEVPTIQEHVKEHFWLIDPRWHLLSREVNLRTLGIDLQDRGTGVIADFMFALRPSTPASYDEVLIVEIKRGSTPDGKVRRVNNTEVNKFHDYVLAAEEYTKQSTVAPSVRGLMIAQAYTPDADRKRRNLEGVSHPKMEFRTWDDVIDETERLHQAWLDVESLRATGPDGPPSAGAEADKQR